MYIQIFHLAYLLLVEYLTNSIVHSLSPVLSIHTIPYQHQRDLPDYGNNFLAFLHHHELKDETTFYIVLLRLMVYYKFTTNLLQLKYISGNVIEKGIGRGLICVQGYISKIKIFSFFLCLKLTQ